MAENGGKEEVEEGKAIFLGGEMVGLKEDKGGADKGGSGEREELGEEGSSMGVVVVVVMVVVIVVIVGIGDVTLPVKGGGAGDFPRTRREENAEGGQD